MRPLVPFALVAAVTTPLTAQAHWALLYPTNAPSPRASHAMTFDDARNRCVVFGGIATQSPPNAQTWLFDGITWTLAPVSGPSGRTNAAIAFDSSRSVVVMFGGYGGGNLDDTWEWNGTVWTPRILAVRPPGRAAAAMAYDPIRQRTVLFGGTGLGDTWTWDGTTWQLQTPAHAPMAREAAAMAFDPNSRTVLLFGGYPNGTPPALNDTWRWNGADWQVLQPATPPWPRGGHAMVTDSARSRVVLVGSDNLPDSLAWEWDGSNWEQQFLSSPAPRVQLGLAYDATRRQLVLFGGVVLGGNGGNANDTWIYRTDSPAEFAPLGAGCSGNLGTPVLTNAPYSLPWLGDLFTSQVAPVSANGPVFFVTGHDAVPPVALAPYGMPGCTLFVSILATDLRFANGTGVASWSLQIPNAVALAGVELAQQCLSLDSGNAAGAVVSSARTLRIGIR